jgi:UDP-2,3-diacylglucosamine hydrolase
MHSILVSDLHLSPERPSMCSLFLRFAEEQAKHAQAVYILGDLFDYWAGDDDPDPFNASVLAALRMLARQKVQVYLMHGNRDFLMGAQLARECGATLLEDPTLVTLYGAPTLLMHGDTLCTDDVKYQEFRSKVRDANYQKTFLAQPLQTRKRIIAALRAENAEEKELKSDDIMDVVPSAVEAVLREYGYPRLIHGHTHRPALHIHQIDAHRCERWVLGDWYQHATYLCCDAQGCRSQALVNAAP